MVGNAALYGGVVGNPTGGGGGGATGGTLNNCTLTGNWAGNGGEAYQCMLNYCTLAGNSAANITGAPPGGGGAYGCTLNYCTLTGNSASQGGGAYESTLNNCTLAGNSAYPFYWGWGGAVGVGGGAYGGTLNNCTLTGNSAYDFYAPPNNYIPSVGGGAYGNAWGNPCTLNNCIIYSNTASSGANYSGSTLNYCCTTPDPGGAGDITNAPLFVDQGGGNLRLQTNSPCINGGNNAFIVGSTDLDGNPRIASGIVDIGAYEFQGPAPLSVGIAATFTNVATGFAVGFTALFGGHTTASLWDFGDGIVASNLVYASHAWANPGDYAVVLWACNESHPEGLSATQMVHVVVPPVHYVTTSSINPLPPYSSWATAATSIQDAVDAGTLPGALVLVSNGVYSTGWRVVFGSMANRVAVDKPLTVRSVNGPQFTTIQGRQLPGTTNGNGAVRCVYLANGGGLSGFTLTKGATRSAGDSIREQSGGGLWCESATAVVSNCVMAGSAAAVEGGGGYGGTLSACILTGNLAQSGGGASESVLSNCTLTGNSAGDSGGGSYQSTLNNCAVTSNSAGKGGGANGGTLSNCTLTGNWAGDSGGGSYQSMLNNCTLTSNSAGNGGGANGGTLNNCTLRGNLASNGGGAIGATLNNCTLTANSAATGGGGVNGCTLNNCTVTGNWAASGGGANGGTLNNCTLTGNSAGNSGGGANGCTLNNCTLTSNSANAVDGSGGGASGGTLNNCIVFFNTAGVGANYDSFSTLNYCCTTPQPTGGTGNISLDPQLASTSHLSAFSPCRGAGNAAYASGTDIDGEAWGVPPSIGCDEYYAGAVTGPLSVAISAAYTNVAVGFPVGLTAVIEGRTSASVWDFGDGIVVSNRPYASHAWGAPGDYVVALWAFNDSTDGVSATVTVHVVAQPVHYVAADSANPLPPYATWATAATNIQDAVDAVTVAGAWVLVTNGTYASGGRALDGTMTNRVAVNKPVTLRSVNGPQFTMIQGRWVPATTNGNGAIRCVYLANGASLSGFTLTKGATRSAGDSTREQTGGGLWCESAGVLVSNCVVTGNSAQSGGGVSGGTLSNCTLTGNSATGGYLAGYGGGAYYGTLKHCTLTGNSASTGGGSYQGTLDDCTLSANSATEGGGACASTLNNCRLSGNSASSGGGACQGTLNNCTLSANSATSGGGAHSATLNDCTLSGNSAIGTGGGACYAALNNCALTGNSAEYGGGAGGGDYACVLNNCTLTGNSAWSAGGGAYSATLNNCIVYFNNAALGANYDSSSSLSYCCTTPQPTGGTGNISLDPQLASASHLSAGSPCRGAGSAAYATGTDIDGEAWGVPPSIGCDEYHAGAVTGPLSVGISAAYTNVAVGFPAGLTAVIEGRTSASVWDFGDGIVVSNQLYASHAWAAAGDYVVVLWAFNESLRAGVSGTVTVRVVSQPAYYVAAGSTNPSPPYTSWATAATNIQDAIDTAIAGGEIIVNNGVYATGGRAVYGAMTNRVVVDKPVTVRSVNGPLFTTIQGRQLPGTTNGNGAVRCVYLANGGGLSGFTLTKGATRSAGDSTREQNGGGLWCEFTSGLVSNCVVASNSAYQNGGGGYAATLNNCTLRYNSARSGCGGAAGGTLNQCTLTGNSGSAAYGVGYGGGAWNSTLNNCTLTGNSAGDSGGGAYQSTLNDCTLSGNSAENRGGGGGGAYGCTLNNCRLSGNSADNGVGGGALGGTLNNCTLNGNSAAQAGGGASGSTLNNCTLTGNSTFWPEGCGGGAWEGTLNNCTLTRNSAWNGGGAFQSALNNCTLTANSAGASGGGAGGTQAYPGSTCTLNNCTLTGNSAGDSGGGTSFAALNNCIVYFNTAKNAANYDSDTILNYCCTTPQPSGAGNITLNPLFVNRAGGNLRLQSNSPCINAGLNAYAPGPTDLDGNPRIVGGTVDIGAYECQSPALLAYFTWLQSYSLPTDAGALYADSDGDGMNNWQEWRCGTCPTNSLSVLQMLSVSNAVSGVTVSWQSVAGVNYFLECSTNLSATPCFTGVATNLPGQPGTTTYTDTNAVGAGPFFYRVGVGN